MTTIEHLEMQVQPLSPLEFAKFSSWLHEFEWQAWDRQIEEDSKTGKLKALAAKALTDRRLARRWLSFCR